MIQGIAIALSSIKTAIDITKILINFDKDLAVKEKAIELNQIIASLQQNIFSIQSDYQSLSNEKENIKKELIELNDWDKKQIEYEPTNLTDEVFIYIKKNPQNEIEKSIKYCCNCFQAHKTNPIQLDKENSLEKIYICHSCNSQYRIKKSGSVAYAFSL